MRKASRIPKSELVTMIARLRGQLYAAIATPHDIEPDEIHLLLEETRFEMDLECGTCHGDPYLQPCPECMRGF